MYTAYTGLYSHIRIYTHTSGCMHTTFSIAMNATMLYGTRMVGKQGLACRTVTPAHLRSYRLPTASYPAQHQSPWCNDPFLLQTFVYERPKPCLLLRASHLGGFYCVLFGLQLSQAGWLPGSRLQKRDTLNDTLARKSLAWPSHLLWDAHDLPFSLTLRGPNLSPTSWGDQAHCKIPGP